MTKILKILGRIVFFPLEWVLFFLIVFLFIIRTSPVQTYLGEKATQFLSKELNTKMHIGKIDIVFFNKVLLKDVYIEDQNKDTIASIALIDIRIKKLDLTNNKFVIKSATLENGNIEIYREAKKGIYNYGFLQDYFDSGKKSTSSSKQPDIDVLAINLKNVDFRYDDYRKSYSTFGMDYDHLTFENLNLSARNFRIREDSFAFYMASFSAKEKCGLELKKLRTYVRIHQKKGIFLHKLSIETPQTRIYARKFFLKVNSFDAFNNFEDSVTWDATIDSSWVSMYDVSLFASALEGMDQKLTLRGNVNQKLANLKVSDLDLRFGNNTIIQGDFNLPDFRNMDSSALNENIRYAYIDFSDIERLKLPNTANPQYISLDKQVRRLNFVEIKNLDVNGAMNDLLVQSNAINTSLGNISIAKAIRLKALKEGGYSFGQQDKSTAGLVVSNFQLGKFIQNNSLGIVDGKFNLAGVFGQKDGFRLTEMAGNVNKFGFNNYNYSNIEIKEGSFKDNVVDTDLSINDPNLQLDFDGKIDLNNGEKFDFDVKLPKVDLGKLGFLPNSNAQLEADVVSCHLKGSDPATMEGSLVLNNFTFSDKGKKISLPQTSLNIDRSSPNDIISLNSSLADITIKGKFDPSTLTISLNNAFVPLLPTLLKIQKYPNKKTVTDRFDLSADLKDIQGMLDIFMPEVELAKNAKLDIDFDHQKKSQSCNLVTSRLTLRSKDENTQEWKGGLYADKVVLTEKMMDGKMSTFINSDFFFLNDSIQVHDIDIELGGEKSAFVNKFKWENELDSSSMFNVDFKLLPEDAYSATVQTSAFYIKNDLWEITQASKLFYSQDRVSIKNLVFEKDNQYIGLNGVLSNEASDKLNVEINQLNLSEITKLVNPGVALDGILNAKTSIQTPFTSLHLESSLELKDLFINKQEIGRITSEANWNSAKNRLEIGDGDLYYQNQEHETFHFNGSIDPLAEKENLKIDLKFKETDISFVNGFMDPTVLSEIKGKLKGTLAVTGSFAAPKIDGKIDLKDGGLKVGMLGTKYTFSGPIAFLGKEGKISANKLPIIDQEGNPARLSANVNFNNFENIETKIKLQFNEADVPDFKGRFLVLNTKFKEGELYYGKAYASGFCNIDLGEMIDINVYAKTETGTAIDMPMYGPSEASDFEHITFITPDDSSSTAKDISNLHLKMELVPTKEAKIRLIFNEQTGDIITAFGDGNLKLKIDDNIEMKGSYVLDNRSNYNFVMLPIKQLFLIEEGSKIDWTGSPYDAKLDIKTFAEVNANFAALTLDPIEKKTLTVEPVRCLLKISRTLSNPFIEFDIDAPSASIPAQNLLTPIRNNPSDLQSNFFSLLALKKFSLSTTTAAGGILDPAMQILNDALENSGFGGKTAVNLNVSNNGDVENVNQTATIGLERKFGDRWVIKGAFGAAKTGHTGSASSSLVGDFQLDYQINPDGSFTATIFNQSNATRTLTSTEKGDFTQGVGLHYQKSFDKIKRNRSTQNTTSGKEKKGRGNKRKVPIPEDKPIVSVAPDAVKKEEENSN